MITITEILDGLELLVEESTSINNSVLKKKTIVLLDIALNNLLEVWEHGTNKNNNQADSVTAEAIYFINLFITKVTTAVDNFNKAANIVLINTKAVPHIGSEHEEGDYVSPSYVCAYQENCKKIIDEISVKEDNEEEYKLLKYVRENLQMPTICLST